MTKVSIRPQGLRIALAAWLLTPALGGILVLGQSAPDKPAEALYLQLSQVGLDAARVYQVRDASLERSAIHITLEDGTIAFTRDVMGRITGAFFEGEGEVLLAPPSDVERRSMSLFTGMAILEEHFATAYFRFNDEAAAELLPGLRATDNKQEFVDRWNTTARNLASADAMRLLISFSRMLPAEGAADTADAGKGDAQDQFFHARLLGTKLGVFEVFFDSLLAEQVQAGQVKAAKDGVTYYDIWTSFSPGLERPRPDSKAAGRQEPDRVRDWVQVRSYNITTEVQPPKQIQARARMQLELSQAGQRALVFQLSRFLQVESVKLDGHPAEFIHNPAMEGSQLSRQGNDVVAVILPQPTEAGQKIELEFIYAGEVLAEAGGGLLYVGARGDWYPNRGMAMADFDLQFDYPQEWTLVATGKPAPIRSETDPAKAKGEQVSRWVSERPIPLAGFNLGKYRTATARAGDVTLEIYASQGVEKNFPNAAVQVIEPKPSDPSDPSAHIAQLSMPSRPSPAMNEQPVLQSAAQAIEYYAGRFGPFPYSHLALTQIPGRESEGWPGLIFLSSYAFLSELEREQLHYEPYQILLQQLLPAHETAHQWWGDLITWKSYRDQWLSEGLANYSAFMMLQEKNPAGFRQIMDHYRQDLLAPDQDGMAPKDAGPVTLGGRLESSRFPGGYQAISYGRATWLFHMLRTMLDDAAESHAPKNGGSIEGPFVKALRTVRQRYAGRSISTRELLDVFAENLPPSLRYQGKKSLDWFMDGWVNGTTLPQLGLKSVKFTPKGTGFIVTGIIVQRDSQQKDSLQKDGQKDATQDLVTSVPLYGVVGGKQPVLLGRVFADGEESTFRLSAPAGVHKILVDPEQTVLTSPK